MRVLRCVALFVGIAVCLVAPSAAGVGAAPQTSTARDLAATNTATFRDSSGEDPLGPDITTVVVSNDDTGLISFAISIPNRTELSGDMLIDLEVDADGNPATGDPQTVGADYAIELFQGQVNLFRWDGTTFSRTATDPPQTTLIFSYANGLCTIQIAARELGNAKKLSFGALAISGIIIDPVTGDTDFSKAHFDFAPDLGHGFWSYEVKLTPPRLVVKSFALTPVKPGAGKLLTARMGVARSDTGAALQNGQVTCAATVGGKRVPARTHSFANVQAVCAWQLPKTAKGKTIRGTITVVFEGLRVSKTFSARIR